MSDWNMYDTLSEGKKYMKYLYIYISKSINSS